VKYAKKIDFSHREIGVRRAAFTAIDAQQ